MKKIIAATLFIGFSALLMTSCKKKNENTNPDGTPDLATFKVVVEGTTYTPLLGTTQTNLGVITYQAQTSNINTNFMLQISDTLMAGTYPITNGLPFRVTYTDDGNNTFYFGTAGSVTVVSNDTVANKIKGTFNATLTRTSPAGTKNLTSGEFNISY